MGEQEKENIKFKDIVRAYKGTIIYVLCTITIVTLLFTFVGTKIVVDGESMSPNFQNGEALYGEKITRWFGNNEYDRYDVIVFQATKTAKYIKRIIGLPGETISIHSGRVYINGALLSSDIYGAELIEGDMDEITIGEDEYFVLGDNRNHSNDSRELGCIKKSAIVEHAVFSFKHFSTIK